MSDHRAILRRLGKNSMIAARMGVDHATVWRWGEYGIPPERWMDIIALGKELRRPIALARLAAATARSKAEVS
jgi:hypothetical protein